MKCGKGGINLTMKLGTFAILILVMIGAFVAGDWKIGILLLAFCSIVGYLAVKK